MQFTRTQVPRPARYAIPAFPLFLTVIGASLLHTPLERLLSTPAFDVAHRLMSIRLWGAGFLLIAAGMLASMLARGGTR
jgi:hypothetical protein